MNALMQLRERRRQLVEEMRSRIERAEAENRDLTTAEEALIETVRADLARVEQDLERAERRLEAERDAALDVFLRGDGRRGPASPPEDDERDGVERRELRPADRFADYARQEHPDQAEELRGVRFGAAIRALVTGPRNDAERRALSAGGAEGAGYMVPSVLSGQIIDRLRARTVTVRAGARTVPLDAAETTMARVETDPATAWHPEGGTIAEDTAMTFGAQIMRPKTLTSLVRTSRELIDDAPNAEEAIERAFSRALAVELDRAVLFGLGAALEPLGIVNYAGIGSVSMGVNGAQLVGYDAMLDARDAMLLANADEPTAFIMAPRTATVLAKAKDGVGLPLRRPTEIERTPFLVTTSVPIDQVQGTATNASSIITGVWSELLIGVRAEVRVEVLRERFADSLSYGFLAWLRADTAVLHAASFAKIIGIIP